MRKAGLTLFLITCIFHLYAQHYVLFGTTYEGGSNNQGTIFSYDLSTSKEGVIYSLDATTGYSPNGQLTLGNNGLLYGVTSQGGKYNYGTLFNYNKYTGALHVLYDFDSVHGSPSGDGPSVIQAKNGFFYGTTFSGGTYNVGVLYSYDSSKNSLTVLYNFDTIHGGWPSNEHLAEDTVHEILYGLAAGGGKNQLGCLFSYNINTKQYSELLSFDDSTGGNAPGNDIYISADSALYFMTCTKARYRQGALNLYNIKTKHDSVVVNLSDSLGSAPVANSMIHIYSGLLYGVINSGGMYHPSNHDFYNGLIYSYNLATNNYSPVFLFDSANGAAPNGALIQNPSDSTLYGVTELGGSSDEGVIFSYNTGTGMEKVIHNFSGIGDGSYPYAGLTLVNMNDSTMGVNNVKFSNSNITVYPNPSNGLFTFQIQGANEKVQMDIYNILGEQVYNKNIISESTQIDLSNQPKGLYLYRITSEKGELIGNGKLVIQ